jgi:hypothetical protein
MSASMKLYEQEMRTLLSIPSDERGRILTALLMATLGEEPSELPPLESAVFELIMSQVERAHALSAKRSMAGSRGGAPNKNTNAAREQSNSSKNKQNQATAADVQPKTNTNTNTNTNTSTSTNTSTETKNIKGNADKSANSRTKKFVPPTVEEIAEYCQSRQNNISPQKFFDHYSVADWHDAKGNKVKNWKQKVITWEGSAQNGSNSGNINADNTQSAGGKSGEILGNVKKKNYGVQL